MHELGVESNRTYYTGHESLMELLKGPYGTIAAFTDARECREYSRQEPVPILGKWVLILGGKAASLDD